MRKIILALSLVVVLFMGAARVQGQPVDEPLPLLIRGVSGDDLRHPVLYRYGDAQWERLPLDDFDAGSRSPDGAWLAYLRMPPFLQTLLNNGQDWLYGTAWDVGLMDMRDDSRRDVAVQPATITADSDGYSGGIKRSLPVWSPDGSALAWTEQDYPALNSARLVVYDLDSNTSRVLDEALPQMNLSADGLPGLLNWGQPGIVVFTNDPSDNAGTLRFYDVSAGTHSIARLPDYVSEWIPLTGPLWVADAVVVKVKVDDFTWYQADPSNDEVAGVATQLEWVSTANPDESLRLVWDIYAEFDQPAWQLLAADGTPLLAWVDPLDEGASSTLTRFVFGVSGNSAAFLQDGLLHLWQDGSATQIAPPDGVRITALYWGSGRWQAGAATDAAG